MSYSYTVISPGRVKCAKTGSSLMIGSARMLATVTSKVPSSFAGKALPSATDRGSIAPKTRREETIAKGVSTTLEVDLMFLGSPF